MQGRVAEGELCRKKAQEIFRGSFLSIQLSNDPFMYVRKLPRKKPTEILEGVISVVHTGAGIVPVTSNQKGKP